MWDIRNQESTECNLGHKFGNDNTRFGLLGLAGQKLTPFSDRIFSSLRTLPVGTRSIYRVGSRPTRGIGSSSNPHGPRPI